MPGARYRLAAINGWAASAGGNSQYALLSAASAIADAAICPMLWSRRRIAANVAGIRSRGAQSM
ncbi:MAG: hypothetical protein ACREE7_04005, partial [Dongiaceae bacterium]